jgi:hypothetical protein
MILNNAPVNEAVLSNVGEIGEFRIRNSAKAFSILSSGLYANKIKAIVRELSCNAVDSHVAAGNADTPFEVHIPNSLEPHFSIRDFGTGLTHEQVSQIYTTYFESTKTNSNAFIGALGLGSKSPFSYTDNFTVTAIKDGIKGIYSAFINGEGVPSIALMMTEQTDEPSGVEVKFSVNERFDFSKFKEEAASVYRYFKVQPTIKGCAEFSIKPREYDTIDLIPGVNVYKESGRYSTESRAIMGNIAYPIAVPNASQLGDLASLLNCGLEIHFGIGEVDFQASREGLSYIPQTVDAIRMKLAAINAQLAKHIAVEADKIPNAWDRAVWLSEKNKNVLWAEACNKYALDTNLETYTNNRYSKLAEFKVKEVTMQGFNIRLRGFNQSYNNRSLSTIKSSTDWALRGAADAEYWTFHVDGGSQFVITDTKVGASERAKFHFRNNLDKLNPYRNIFVLEAIDADKPMDTVGFFAAIKNPPETRIRKASTLDEKPRKEASVGRDVSILTLEERRRGYSAQVVWADAGKMSAFSKTDTHYYVPLSGYSIVTDKEITDTKELVNYMKMSGLTKLKNIKVLGVRKSDMEEVQKSANWINVEKYIEQSLTTLDNNLVMNMVVRDLGRSVFTTYNYETSELVDSTSPFMLFNSKFKGVVRTEHNDHALRTIYRVYGTAVNAVNPEQVITEMTDELAKLNNRYPMLKHIGNNTPEADVASYIKMIDTLKGI